MIKKIGGSDHYSYPKIITNSYSLHLFHQRHFTDSLSTIRKCVKIYVVETFCQAHPDHSRCRNEFQQQVVHFLVL